MQALPVYFFQNRTATGSQYRWGLTRLGELINYSRFMLTKRIFAKLVEEGTNRHIQPLLQHRIGIDEVNAQAACQLPANGGLAAAWQANECDDLRQGATVTEAVSVYVLIKPTTVNLTTFDPVVVY